MAYRLTRGGRIANELARLLKEEFQKALDELTRDVDHPEEAVHEARKSVKKIRAVLRLIRKSLGRDYGVEDRRLRNIAHQLSTLRDLDAATEILKAVRDHYSNILTPSAFAAIQHGLLNRKRRTVTRLHPDRLLPRLARDLKRQCRKTRRLVKNVTGFAPVEKGVTLAYRRARTAMRAVESTPEDDCFTRGGAA